MPINEKHSPLNVLIYGPEGGADTPSIMKPAMARATHRTRGNTIFFAICMKDSFLLWFSIVFISCYQATDDPENTSK